MPLQVVLAFLTLCLLLSGCVPAKSPAVCTVIFEDDPSIFFERQIFDVPKGGDITLSVGVPTGNRVSSVNFERCSISARTGSTPSFDYYTLTLQEIRYPIVVRVEYAPVFETVCYANGGSWTAERISVDSPHIAANVPAWREAYSRDGFLAVGWNTRPDGDGVSTCFGGRAVRDGDTLTLYMEWLPHSPLENFSFSESDGELAVTGYTGGSGGVVIPDHVDGLPVTSVMAGAFGDLETEYLVLPPTLRRVESGAFDSLRVKTLTLFDGIEELSDSSFGDYSVETLRVNAIRPPVYSRGYFATLSDKMDYLRSLGGQKKLILFCGSSARFGYDSPRLEAAFPEYKVANMGVYAYANMLPQAKMVLALAESGDILLSSPELDAIDCQFCGETALDKETFCMLEADYELLSLLDMRDYTQVFDALGAFLSSRRGMEVCSYTDSPSLYDEDGVRQFEPTYNKYGDYVLFRENNPDGHSFGIKRAFYNTSHLRPQDVDGLNRVYEEFIEKGVEVYFTYSPRMRGSVSPDSTSEAITELDRFLRDSLVVPVISPIEDSLMDPLYFYATDNHLSTEGVSLRTGWVIDYLRSVLRAAPT